MNILLTNDDGYNSEGINLLVKLIGKYGDVTIVAPKEAMSGKGVSIIYGRPVEVKKVSDNVFVMEGTPADCTAFGLSSLDKKFDLVVSGINNGFNLSWDTMYSGTIGACLQALTYRVPAIAFSTIEGNFEIVEKYFDEVMEYISSHNLINPEHVISINFPVSGTAKGIKETKLWYRDVDENTFYVRDVDDKYIALRDIKDEVVEDVDSDCYAVFHGYISITKLNKTF